MKTEDVSLIRKKLEHLSTKDLRAEISIRSVPAISDEISCFGAKLGLNASSVSRGTRVPVARDVWFFSYKKNPEDVLQLITGNVRLIQDVLREHQNMETCRNLMLSLCGAMIVELPTS